MAQKIIPLPLFKDERGILYLLDLETIDKTIVSKDIEVFEGIQTLNSPISSNSILVCVAGSVEIASENSTSTIQANHYIELTPNNYHISSSVDAIFIILTLCNDSLSTEKEQRKYVSCIPLTKDKNRLKLTELLTELKFGVKRLFYIQNVPPTQIRGNHAHYLCSEIMLALRGEFVLTENNEKEYTVKASETRASYLIPNNVLSKESKFSENAICLVLADTHYDPRAYHS